MNKKHLFKKVIAFMIVLIGTLTLSACRDKTPKIPYGSLDETVFLKGDGFEVSKKELYQEMRTSDLSELKDLIYNIVMAEEIKKVEDNFEDYKDDFVEIANRNIFYTDEIKDLKEIKDKDLLVYVDKFIDLMYLDGIIINHSDIDTVEFTEHSKVVLEYYILEVAKKEYARELLDEDIYDEDSNYYIDVEEDLNNYFKQEVKDAYPLSSINIRFTNSYEANQTLRHFNLKTYRSQWYLIPNPREDVVSGYALEVLTKLDLEGKNGELSESEHQEYYDSYVVNPNREPVEDADVSLTLDQVANKFIEISNFVYPYKDQIDISLYQTVEDILDDSTLVNGDEDELGVFTKTFDDYPSAQSSLRRYIYDTLSTEEDGTRYTASPRSYGSYYFITFKLQDHDGDLKNYVDDEDELIIYEDEDEKTLTSYAQEYFDEIAKNKLGDQYIDIKFREKLDDVKVEVFDEIIYLHLNNDDLPVTFNKKGDGNVLVKVDDKEILVDEYYELLAEKIGSTIAMDLAVRQLLFASDYMNEITDKMKAEYKENVENVIREFSQDGYLQSGMPASIGRKNFLRLAFGSETIEEVVDKVYVRNELERLFFLDYERFYGEEIYETFTDLANRAQDQFFEIKSSHLLVYIDMDEDDEPDNPEDFFKTLDEEEQTMYKDMVTEIIQIVHDRASKHANFAAGLRSVVNDFNDSTKFRTGLCDVDDGIEYRPECTWANYKRYGFFLKFEELGETQNKTNYPDDDAPGLDQNFFDRLEYLYGEVKEEYYEVDKKFPSQKFDVRPVTYDGDDENLGVLETSFGWHLILVTGGDVAKSAEFTYKDDTYIDRDDAESLKVFEEITIKNKAGEDIILDAYSDTDNISVDQVRIYLYESETDRGVVSLPNEVLTALNAYLAPVLAKYQSNFTKMNLLHKLISEANYTFTDSNSQDKLNGILDINRRQFLEYTTEDSLFLDMYEDWFEIFK